MVEVSGPPGAPMDALPVARLVVLPDFLLSAAAGVLWYVWPELSLWPLALVVAGKAARAVTGPPRRLLPFDLPLALFLASAGVGLWLAYDAAAACAKFWVIVGGVALYDSVALIPARVRVLGRVVQPVHLLAALLPAVIALYFLLTTDWPRWAGKLPWLDPIMRWLALWQPALPGHRLHPNVAGGLIAAWLPVQIAVLRRARAAWVLAALAAAGLIMSGSRGAWISLAAVSAIWLVWRLAGRLWPRRLWLGLLGLAVALVVLAAVLALSLSFLGGRPALLRNSLDLALDYPFTGLGLAGFQMAYSTYVLLLHVGDTVHSHNLLLDIWLEQGAVGALAFIWLLVAALRASAARPWRIAAWAMLGVILLHGLADDAFYGSRGVLLLFLPFALLARAEASAHPDSKSPLEASPTSRVRLRLSVPVFAAAVILAVAALAHTRPARAAVQANLASTLQTRAELSVYSWPAWPIQDAVRRSPAVDLEPAIARHRAALALDSRNVTANRRLGQIELSRGQYEAARQHLEAAYGRAPDQRATRQLLAEAYALTGDPARAAALWRTVDLSQGQVAARIWWHQSIGEPDAAARIERTAP